MIKNFEQFVYDIYTNPINESFESKTIQEFINMIKSSEKVKLYFGFFGGGFKELQDGYQIKDSYDTYKSTLEFFYKILKLGSLKEDWIYNFKQFDNKKIVDGENLFDFLKIRNSQDIHLVKLHEWCNNNHTLMITVHDKKYLNESDYIKCIFIDPQKANEFVEKCREFYKKRGH
jgi:hypothetical protein